MGGFVYTYRDVVTGQIGYQGYDPISVDPDGSITVVVTIPGTNHTGVYGEGHSDGSVRRSTAGAGEVVALTESIDGVSIGNFSLPTIEWSAWEQQTGE
jgi:hypothetical protein